MKTKLLVLFIVLGMVFTVLGVPNSADAKMLFPNKLKRCSLRTNVSGELGVHVIDPGNQYISPLGTFHYRGMIVSLAVSGDVTGSGTMSQNSDWDANGNGVIRGPFSLNVEYKGKTGAFSGNFLANMSGYFLTGKFKLSGSGNFSGLTWVGEFTGFLSGHYVYSGYIF